MWIAVTGTWAVIPFTRTFPSLSWRSLNQPRFCYDSSTMSRSPVSARTRLFIVLLLPVILPLAIVGMVLHVLNTLFVYLLVWAWWLPRGKDVLYVSSDSPIWKEYMETEVFPLVAQRAKVLNWSARKMAEVVFRCSSFPLFWPWARFQPHGRIISPFSPCKDF